MENQKKNINEKTENINQTIENLKKQILKNQKKIDDLELRKLANIENIKKNAEQKIKEIKNIETERFLKKMVQIVEPIEKILEISEKLNKKEKILIEGINLTLESLFNIFKKSGVETEGKENELFNSNLHDAVFFELSKKTPPKHIISVIKKGFSFKKTSLKKAKVIVSKSE